MTGFKTKVMFFVIGVLFFATFPQFYWAAPISGTVVDERTGTPLENALVVVAWERQAGWFHPINDGVFEVKESVTNQSGKFYVAWYYPRLRWPFQKLPNYDPIIFVFHKDRKLKTYSNNAMDRRNMFNPIVASIWNHSTISAGEIKGANNTEYFESFNVLSYFLSDLFRNSPCKWKKIKNLLRESYKLQKLAKQSNFPFDICSCSTTLPNDCGASRYLESLKDGGTGL